MIIPGLVSVTFRQLEPAAVVALAVSAGLKGIEWGGDVHVPAGDLETARHVGAMTTDAGLTVACYGSYLRLDEVDGDRRAVVSTAAALGAPLIRVWAGRLPSGQAGPEHWERVVDAACEVSSMAADAGIDVAFEYHRNTLTDSRTSALRLLGSVDLPNVGTLWQPEPTRSEATNLTDLATVLPRLRNVHVFSWTPDRDRLPLASQASAWAGYLKLAASATGDRYALLEFVADDHPAQLAADAATLLALLNGNG